LKWRRWARWLGLLLGAGLLLFVFGWVPYFLGGMATTRQFHFPDKENAGLTPASFSLGFEEVAFTAPDGVALRGWWVPAAQSQGTVVLVHGLNRSRIEMVRKVPFVHRLGWNALLFDLRHHGESGGSATTFGQLEKEDVRAGIALARGRAAGPVVLWGVSLGAAACVLAAADDPSVAGLVSDSSFRDLADTVNHHLQIFRGFRWWLRIVPTWPVADEILFWMGRRGGFNPGAVDIRAAASHLSGRPVLFVANSEDRRMPKEIAFTLQAAAGDRASVLVVPGKSHGGAYRDGTAAYESAVATLLASARNHPAAGQLATIR
jgi:pimeloyl-ACP methyl ester carboxylesterase